ncbi:Uncharacterised protein [Legionella steigerwaltii]|uniref:Uncharacterized protein n=1 Tax=Legionella steigerwaltii TaxID=460 RepID=A0A378LC07_9GAMM|nr:hypothetical protein [Legionella steigerwaltii]KTD78192.1 hypothetical protein Lstg_1473 [Legionella steigerwaltii]STY24386.1 Uncharacterised protein [Legionella steigerwaltii]
MKLEVEGKSDENDKDSKDFVDLMASVKAKHHVVSVNEANCSVSYYSKQLAALSTEATSISSELERTIDASKLAITKRLTLKPLSRLEQWAIEDYHGQANPFKQFALWAYNLGAEKPLQETAVAHRKELSDTLLDVGMKKTRIANLREEQTVNTNERRQISEKFRMAETRQKSLGATKQSTLESAQPSDTPELTDGETFNY